jgi:hypothetical protein
MSTRLRRHLPAILVICLAGGLVAGFYLNLYRAGNHTMPLGYDTSRYLGQTALVAERGLAGASDVRYPPPSVPLGSQIGYPILVLSLSRLFGGSIFKFGAVVPAASLAALALAAGTVVSFSLRRSAIELATVALIVGGSTPLVRLFLPEAYNDNIFAAALFVAALVPLLSWLREGRGLPGSVLLLGCSGLIHPSFVPVELGILALAWLCLLPDSWRAWRRDATPPASLPAVRLVTAVASSLVFMALFIYGLLGTSPRPPALGRGVFEAKLRADLSLYAFPVTLPLAALGLLALGLGVARVRGWAGAFALDGGPARQQAIGAGMLLAILAGWTLVTAVGLIIFNAGVSLPAHRLLAFWLALPLLGAVAVLGVAQLARARAGLLAGMLVCLVAVGGLGWIGYQNLYDVIPRTRGAQPITDARAQDAATADAYLDAADVPASRPVVFVVTHGGKDVPSAVQLDAFILRMELSPDRVERTYVYVGEAENYLAGEPTRDPNDTGRFNRASREYWPAVRKVLSQHPVALVLDAYYPPFRELAAAHPDWVVAPGVVVLAGPRPAAEIAAPPVQMAPQGARQLLAFGLIALAMFSLVGLGWAVALLPAARLFEILALSVAVGLGLLVVAGVVLESVGLRLGGAGGLVNAPLTAAMGWGAAYWARRRRAHGAIEGGTDHADRP